MAMSNLKISMNDLLKLCRCIIPKHLAKVFSDRVSSSDAVNLAYVKRLFLAHAKRLLSSHVANTSVRMLLATISIKKKNFTNTMD
ncbi:MAG: hypothetical protein ACI9MS_001022 [Glaciecola sp.]